MTNITSKYLNQDKRESEAVTVTLPAVSNVGGGRTQQPITYNQFGEDYVSYTIPKNTILKKFYLIVEEAFPASAEVAVTVNGVAAFSAVALDVTGLTTSTSEDFLADSNATVNITVTGGTGDITTGILRVVTDIVSYSEKNGRYASYAHTNDNTQAR